MQTPPDALAQFVRAIPLFEQIEDRHLADILRLLRPVELQLGEVLFREGERGAAFWVLEGATQVAVHTRSGDGQPVIVAQLGAGEVVGEMALIDEAPRSATAHVTRGGRAYHIQASDFASLRTQGHPAAFQILRRLCTDLCRRLRATSDRVVRPSGRMLDVAERVGSRRPRPEELDAFPAFRAWPQVVKLALSERLVWVETRGVEPICAEGEPADSTWFIVEGEVVVGRNGRTLERMGPGQMFGLVAALDGGPRSASCVASGPTRLLQLADADFDALFASGNRFAYHLVDLVARQLVAHLRGANRLLPALPPEAQPPSQEELEAELEDLLPLDLELAMEGEVLPGATG